MIPVNKTAKKQIRTNTQDIANINETSDFHYKRVLSSSNLGGGGDSGGTPVRRAKVTQDAPAGSTITANLFDATSGVEATSGDEFGVTLYTNISNGSTLDLASRGLKENDEVFIVESVFDNAGTPETRWYIVSGFDTVKDCVCQS